jgi:hypothetical protein
MLIDTHTHLYLEQFDQDRDQVIQNQNNSSQRYVNPNSYKIESVKAMTNFIEQLKQIRDSLGDIDDGQALERHYSLANHINYAEKNKVDLISDGDALKKFIGDIRVLLRTNDLSGDRSAISSKSTILQSEPAVIIKDIINKGKLNSYLNFTNLQKK